MLQTRDTIFFDLFYTLVNPEYLTDYNENDVVGIERGTWEAYAEDDELYARRASGIVTNPQKIVDEILLRMKKDVSDTKRREVLRLREERIQKSLLNVDGQILDVLEILKERGWRLGIISNADVIDAMHWTESPLSIYFDSAIFSFQVGCLKPHSEIYKTALKKMNANPGRCVFVGDGGSNELQGAKRVGMTTILTTHYRTWADNQEDRNREMYADHHVKDFRGILRYV